MGRRGRQTATGTVRPARAEEVGPAEVIPKEVRPAGACKCPTGRRAVVPLKLLPGSQELCFAGARDAGAPGMIGRPRGGPLEGRAHGVGERLPCNCSTSGKRSGLLRPRLNSVTVWPRASAPSTSARPRKTVPPRISIRIAALIYLPAGENEVRPLARILAVDLLLVLAPAFEPLFLLDPVQEALAFLLRGGAPETL